MSAEAVTTFVEKYREEGRTDEEIQRMLLNIEEDQMGLRLP